jgi:methyl-accepting chemotaxis protein
MKSNLGWPKRKFRLSVSLNLKNKLVISFLSILVVVMLVTTVYYINASTARIKSDLQDKLFSNSIAANIMVESDTKMLDNLCLSISNDNSLKMLLQFQMASQISDYCKGIIDKNSSIDTLLLSDASGKVLFSNNEDFTAALAPLVKKSEETSGLYLLKNINKISLHAVKDSTNVNIGFVIIAHNMEKDVSSIKDISSKIKAYTLLYRGSELLFMTDMNKKIYNPKDQNVGKVAFSKICKMPDGSYSSNTTKPLFNLDLFINYKCLKDLEGNPIGLLAVAETDTALKNNSSKVFMNMLLISVISIVIASILIYLLAYRMTKPINELVSLMKKVENGDLTVKSLICRKDEIGFLTQGFNRMVEELNKLVLTIITKSEDILEASTVLSEVYTGINTGVNDIVVSIKEVAEGNENNSASVEEVSAGLQEVAGEASTIANECNTSLSISALAVNNADNGIKSISKVKASVNNIVDKSHITLATILELEQYSRKIESIVKAIIQIADSINLLGLNAAIEAARAGNVGAGFAVVAEEINKLSMQTKNKVNEVTEINREIINRVNDSVHGIKQSTNVVEESVILFSELENAIAGITQSITDMDANVRKITDGAVAQASTSEEIAVTMDNITSITVQTAEASASIYEAAKNVSENMNDTKSQITVLEETSKNLKELVKRFKVIKAE